MNGIFFDLRTLRAVDLGAIFGKIIGDGKVRGCTLSYSGANLTIAKGHMVAKGRLIAFDNAETIASETTSANGYGRLKLSIDLSQAASGTSFAQALFSWDYADTNSFAALTQNDINDGTNTAYQVEICRVSFYNGTISGIVSQIGGSAVNMAEHTHDYAAKSQTKTASLTVEGWEEDAANAVWTQTVSVTGVTANSNIIVSPAPASHEAWGAAGIRATAQAAGTVTFACDTVPTEAITAQILIVG
ncbi:MAG: hypothetical protein DBX63_06555 [Clostridia bacterium]|nr:MAG: hypothetical protein DBX63_06555 [Clostridia bacterium]